MEKKERKIDKKGIVALIISMILVILAGTFAWLSYRTQDTAMVLTIGEIQNIQVTLTPYQINSSLGSFNDYSSGLVTNVEATNNSSTSKKFKLYYKVDSIDSALAISSFKYTITRSTSKNGTYSKLGSDGNFSGVTSGDNVVILDETLTAGQTYYYKVYLWLDGSGNVSSAQGKTFTGELRAEIISLSDQYQQVEYLQSSGTQYIMTNIVATNTHGVYAKLSSANITSDLLFFGSKASSTNSRFWVGNSNTLYFGWNTVLSNKSTISQNVVFTLQMNYYNNRKTIFNGTTTNSNLATLTTNSNKIAIFAGNNGSIVAKSSIKLYEIKFSNGSEDIAHFVPCYDKYNMVTSTKYNAGLCDVLHNEFYPNQGTDYFDYGPAV